MVADSDELDEKAQISLLTMHNAKGLEWPSVYVAGLEEGLFPHSRSLDNEEALEEERRLCYVALTRAQKKLTLTWAQVRRRYGGGAPEASLPSRFLEEIPKRLTERLDDKVSPDRVDLFVERREVRDTVKKNLFTGKTYNSVDNISQFFSERGMPAPRGFTQPAVRSPVGSQTPVPPAQVPQPRPAAPGTGAKVLQMPLIPRDAQTPQPTRPVGSPAVIPARMVRAKKPFGPGSVVEHPRYGRGTVLRREGDGDDAKLTITFPKHGLKKLVERFAGLKIED